MDDAQVEEFLDNMSQKHGQPLKRPRQGLDDGEVEGEEIFLTLRNIFGLILNHVRYDDSRLELCKNLTNSK